MLITQSNMYNSKYDYTYDTVDSFDTLNESIEYQPQMIPIIESQYGNLISIESIQEYAEDNGIEDIGYAINVVCESNGVDLNDLVFTVQEEDVISGYVDNSLLEEMVYNNIPLVMKPISKYSPTSIILDECLDYALDTGDYSLLESVLLNEENIGKDLIYKVMSRPGSSKEDIFHFNRRKLSTRYGYSNLQNHIATIVDRQNLLAHELRSLYPQLQDKTTEQIIAMDTSELGIKDDDIDSLADNIRRGIVKRLSTDKKLQKDIGQNTSKINIYHRAMRGRKIRGTVAIPYTDTFREARKKDGKQLYIDPDEGERLYGLSRDEIKVSPEDPRVSIYDSTDLYHVRKLVTSAINNNKVEGLNIDKADNYARILIHRLTDKNRSIYSANEDEVAQELNKLKTRLKSSQQAQSIAQAINPESESKPEPPSKNSGKPRIFKTPNNRPSSEFTAMIHPDMLDKFGISKEDLPYILVDNKTGRIYDLDGNMVQVRTPKGVMGLQIPSESKPSEPPKTPSVGGIGGDGSTGGGNPNPDSDTAPVQSEPPPQPPPPAQVGGGSGGGGNPPPQPPKKDPEKETEEAIEQIQQQARFAPRQWLANKIAWLRDKARAFNEKVKAGGPNVKFYHKILSYITRLIEWLTTKLEKFVRPKSNN